MGLLQKIMNLFIIIKIYYWFSAFPILRGILKLNREMLLMLNLGCLVGINIGRVELVNISKLNLFSLPEVRSLLIKSA